MTRDYSLSSLVYDGKWSLLVAREGISKIYLMIGERAMEEKWMSINDYSRSFSISDMTVRRRIRSGKLQAVLRDGKYFIHVPDGHEPFPDSDAAPSQGRAPVSVPLVSHPGTTNSNHAKPRQQGASHAPSHHGEFRHVPSHLAASIGSRDSVNVSSAELLSFCEASLRKFADFERRIVAENQTRIQALQQELNARNLELKQLKQQVEDLQVLVNLMESRG